MLVTSSERIRVPSSASGNPAVSSQEPGRATMLPQPPDVGVLRADLDPEAGGHACTLSLRRPLRRTFPASSRTGSQTHSKLRGTL